MAVIGGAVSSVLLVCFGGVCLGVNCLIKRRRNMSRHGHGNSKCCSCCIRRGEDVEFSSFTNSVYDESKSE